MTSFVTATSFPNPFLNASRSNWNITPPQEIWKLIPKGVNESGYGCFFNPTRPYGFPLFNTSSMAPVSNPSDLCGKGFFCPYLDVANSATYPVSCPAVGPCYIQRGQGVNCDIPQGIFEPMACPKGYYCPSYNEIRPCPVGSYCLTGSSKPTPCEYLSICGAKTVVQVHYGLFLIVFVTDTVLLTAFLVFRYREFRRANPGKSLFGSSKLKTLSSAEGEGAMRKRTLSTAQIQENIQTLTAGFQKGLEGHTDLSMNYEFENLGLRLPDGKDILQGVSGTIKAGRMTAIMGPSGAGKTTFMNVLMGKATRTSGSLKINDTIAEMQEYRKIIGYVPQDDVMIEELTVRENIRYSARTRLPNSWPNSDVDSHVDAILTALNLNHVAHSRVGSTLVRGISGGQRKRVNIGMELAAAPLSVFLDEPTSGLDSTAALDVTNILHSISRLGLTVVAVIHQPRVEIFETFDDVLMVAPGGLTAYFGPISEAQAYFESIGFSFRANANVADTLMDILSGRGEIQEGLPSTRASVREVITCWTVHLETQNATTAYHLQMPQVKSSNQTTSSSIESMTAVAKKRGASFFRQVGLSHNRFVAQQAKLASAFMQEVFVGLICGLIMGVASGGGENFTGRFVAPFTPISPAPRYWFNDMYGMLIGITIALASAPSAVKVFSEEIPMYLREAEAGHNSTAYFIGKNLGSLYRILLASAHFAGCYILLAQPPIGSGNQWLLIFLNIFGVYGQAQIVSMLVKRENAALLAVIPTLLSEVFCGFGPSIPAADSGHYGFILGMGVNRWMAEAQFFLWAEPYADTIDLTDAANYSGYENGHTLRNMLIMVALALSYRLVAYALFLVVLRSGFFKRLWVQAKLRLYRKRDVTSSTA
ncbi:hypothetical protein BC830DRAFT_1257030 [Chytriomyces sp. MP71]|nr:hypothetical protein BC830DRAFT_1257030 [Chytriomyces sp. MP71]